MTLNPKLLLVTIYFCLLVNKQNMVLSKPATGDIVVNNEININIEGGMTMRSTCQMLLLVKTMHHSAKATLAIATIAATKQLKTVPGHPKMAKKHLLSNKVKCLNLN